MGLKGRGALDSDGSWERFATNGIPKLMDAKRYLHGICCFFGIAVGAALAKAEDWPQWLGEQRDGVWRESGLLQTIPKTGLALDWRVPVGGGYSGPSVQKGKIFVSDRVLEKGIVDPANLFARSNSKGQERLLCLEESSGKTLWEQTWPSTYQISYPCGPRATPLADSDRVLVLGAMGDLICFESQTGKLLWRHNFPKDFAAPIPVWGFAAHPIRIKDTYVCLVGGKGSLVVAFDRNTGTVKWKSGSLGNPGNEIGYCPPTLFEMGGKQQLIIWQPEALVGLNPDSGKQLWSVPFKIKANLSIAIPRQVGNRILVSSFYNGSMLVEPGANQGVEPKVIWKGEGRGEHPEQTKSLNSIMSNPWVEKGTIFGVCSYGQLRALECESGKRLWMDLRATSAQGKVALEATERWANAFIVPLADPTFQDTYLLFNEKGEMIQAQLTTKGYTELGRVKLIQPTGLSGMGNRPIVWSHPALANRSIVMRNDKEIVRYNFSEIR